MRAIGTHEFLGITNTPSPSEGLGCFYLILQCNSTDVMPMMCYISASKFLLWQAAKPSGGRLGGDTIHNS